MDYGAALEMRFGATHRGFESRPLRHTRPRAMAADACVAALRSSLTHLRVRSLRCSVAAFASTTRAALASARPIRGLTSRTKR